MDLHALIHKSAPLAGAHAVAWTIFFPEIAHKDFASMQRVPLPL
jgi:hypothetical protein